MTGPRKRTLLAVTLLVVMAIGGTANSSEAARKKAGSKNHSTKVKKDSKQGHAKQSVIAYRHTRGTARPVASRSGFAGTQRSWVGAGKKSHQATNTGNDRSGAVVTPRAATGTENTRESLKTSQGATADAAVLEALARRKAWADPRRSLLEPVKVQDPAVAEREQKVVAKSAPEVGRASVDRPGVQVARADVAEGSYNEDLIREALRNRGKPYVWGGASRGGFDCSGFMCYIFAQQRGIKLPHSASAQARLGSPVAADALQPGDLVFFSTYRRGISHVGMFLGEGRFIHAANTRRDVRIDTLTSGYYANRLKAARRLTKDPLRLSPAEIRALTQDASVLPMGEER